MTLGAALLVLAGVMAPLGLRDEIVPGSSQAIEFEYVRDQTSWGKVTPVRPDRRFGRYCEFGRRLNCPGQYQGIDFVEMPPGSGNLTSVKKDPSSTINTTLPANYTAMFSSGTADVGNTVSGMFDVQYRRWKAQYNDIGTCPLSLGGFLASLGPAGGQRQLPCPRLLSCPRVTPQTPGSPPPIDKN